MDITDIQTVNKLSAEQGAIQQAMAWFDKGGRIVEMSIGQPQEQNVIFGMLPAAIKVSTQYIDYPAQMVDAIKAAFESRLQAIENELSQLGVTGMPSRRSA